MPGVVAQGEARAGHQLAAALQIGVFVQQRPGDLPHAGKLRLAVEDLQILPDIGGRRRLAHERGDQRRVGVAQDGAEHDGVDRPAGEEQLPRRAVEAPKLRDGEVLLAGAGEH